MTPGTSVMAHSYAPLGPVHAPAGLGKQTCVPVQQSDHENVKAFIRSQRSLKKKKKERKKVKRGSIQVSLWLEEHGYWSIVAGLRLVCLVAARRLCSVELVHGAHMETPLIHGGREGARDHQFSSPRPIKSLHTASEST